MGSRQMAVRAGSGFGVRALLGGLVALVVTVPLLTVVPIAAAQAAEVPVAVDVDLIDGGVWVTFSNGCIESRAWRQPFDEDGSEHAVPADRRCAVGDLLFGPNYYFYYPRLIRAPLVLDEGEGVVALVPTDGGRGYWLVTSAGRVVTGGAARSLGDLSAFTLNAPVVAAAPTESGEGYYMLSADGGVFTFGDAQFYGSVQGLVDEHVGVGALAVDHITAPVVTLATTPAGYWLVAADGAVFPFGDAAYHGSIQDSINTGNQLSEVNRDWVLTPPQAPGAPLARDALSEPVIGVVPSGGGAGYQMVAADGGIFNFGVSQFHGSLAGRARSPAVASDVTESRSGYVILTEGGAVHRFGVMDGEWNPVGRAPTALTSTTLPASECRPQGEQGVPLPWFAALPTGPYDVGVLLVEFDDHRALRELWTMDAITEELNSVEQYLESSSYGKLDVQLTLSDDWISLGPLHEDFQAETAIKGFFGLGSDALVDRAIERATGRFDLSNRGMGYDHLILIFPPSLFYGGLALQGRNASAAGVTIGDIGILGAFGPNEERITQRHAWWTTAAHELLHLPGLPDLYAYDAELQQPPNEWRTTSYGLMDFSTFWPWRPDQSDGWRTGEITTLDGRSFFDQYYNFAYQQAGEMLAWHRWRMGWLRASQVVCLVVGDATVDLAPIARPEDGVAMLAVRLSDTRFLVLERRARIGYDADWLGAHSQDVWYYRVLDDEGVLAYTVDIDVRGGQLPVRLFAENRQLRPGDGWILKSGDSLSSTLEDGTTLRLDVTEGPDGSSRVQITTS